jgi:hypothetical protein
MSIDIQKFCASNDGREYLKTPFQFDGKTTATNGHMLIVAEGAEVDITNHPPAEVLDRMSSWLAEPTPLEWMPLSSVVIPDGVLCGTCNGAGEMFRAVYAECGECNGTGSMYCDMNHEHDCNECDGEGEIETDEVSGTEKDVCPTCEGEKVKPLHPVQVGDCWLQRKYLLLLAELPDCQLAGLNTEGKKVFFKFAGGRGFLMPMRAPTPAEMEFFYAVIPA